MDAKEFVKILEEMNPTESIQFTTKTGFEFIVYRKENNEYDIEVKDYSGDGIIASNFERVLTCGGIINFYNKETRVFSLNPWHIFFIYKIGIFGSVKIDV